MGSDHSTLTLCATALAALMMAAPAAAYVNVYGGPTYTPGVGGFKEGFATGVNDAGTAIGVATKYDAAETDLGVRPFRWDGSGAAATELGNLGADVDGYVNSYPYGINSAGTVVGFSENYDGSGEYPAYLPVRWDASGTVATELDNFGTDTSNYSVDYANAINDAGIAVGSVRKYDGSGGDFGDRAVRWDASGTVATELGNLGTESSGFTYSAAYAINEAGTTVGYAWKINGSDESFGTRAVRWDASGTVATELGTLGTDIDGFTYNEAFTINEAGTVAGWAELYDSEGTYQGSRAVRWDASGTTATELGTLGTDIDGVANTYSNAINNAGTIVGDAERYDGSGEFLGYRAVRWDAWSTAATELGNLGTDSSGYTDSGVHAINDAGIAVGYATDYDGSGTLLGDRAVYWGLGGVAVDLNTLIDPLSGWTLEYADVISNTGWIAGAGMFDPDGPGGHEAYERLFLMQVAAIGVLPGDYNGDGVVDAADYTVWRDTLGSTTDLRANGDDTGASQGVIDEADFVVWKAHFGQTEPGSGAGAAAGSAAVPEPASGLLLILGAAFGIFRR